MTFKSKSSKAFNKLAPVLVSTFILAACENPMKTMETMKETTVSMKNTTGGMSVTTEDMKDNMLVMHDQVRIKEARDTRNFELAGLLNSDNGLAKKLAHAGVFFKAMEYQLWTNNPQLDDAAKRDALILDAVKEFIREISDIHGRINTAKLSPVKTYKKSLNDEFAFFALSAAMHENNHYQELLHEELKGNFELLSFYDIVKKSILKEKNGQELKAYELDLLSIRNILDDMIQARFDVLVALGVKNLGDKAGMDLGDKLSALGFKLTGGKIGKIKMKSLFENSSYAVKKDIVKKLDGAKKVLDFAIEADIQLTMDETLKSLIENLVLDAQADQNDVLLQELMSILEKLNTVESR